MDQARDLHGVEHGEEGGVRAVNTLMLRLFVDVDVDSSCCCGYCCW